MSQNYKYLPKKWQDYISRLTEGYIGYWYADIELTDGDSYKDVVICNPTILNTVMDLNDIKSITITRKKEN